MGVRAFAAIVFSLAALASGWQVQPPLYHYESNRVSMACTYAIDAYGPDGDALPTSLDAALDEVDRIDRLMSNYKASSPLSRINREAADRAVPVDPELFDFLEDAFRYSRESSGAFDITVGPLMKAWGFFAGEGHLPGDAELAEARGLVGARHVTLDRAAHTVRFDRRGVELDLGGIAKGYAVDRAVSILRQRGIPAALVSAGGSTIYALGAPPGRSAWDVAIADPLNSRATALHVPLTDRALSVAGRSEKFFDAGGVRYSHIMDPRTGRPVQGVLTVAVLTDTGTKGDALDDGLFVLGVEGSRSYRARLRGTEVIFFLPVSPGGWKMVRL